MEGIISSIQQYLVIESLVGGVGDRREGRLRDLPLVALLRQLDEPAIGHFLEYLGHVVGRPGLLPDQLPRAHVQRGRVAHQEHVPGGVRLERLPRHERVAQIILGAGLPRLPEFRLRDEGLVVEVDVVPRGRQFRRRHPLGQPLRVPHRPLEQPRLDLDLDVVALAASAEEAVAGLDAAEGRRAVGVPDVDQLLLRRLADLLGLEHADVGQGGVLHVGPRPVRSLGDRLGHVQVLPRVLPGFIEAVRDPDAESEVHALAVPHQEELARFGPVPRLEQTNWLKQPDFYRAVLTAVTGASMSNCWRHYFLRYLEQLTFIIIELLAMV
jgi:hypothetical protein